MAQTALITGTSSGIGRATARLFHDRGWNVVATMRNPEAETELTDLDRVLVTRLDVTDLSSIDAAVTAGIERFGRIDALVNNAGYGAYGPLEATPREKIVRQFDTNVIGLLDTTKALLGHFRARGSGTIVNLSSMGGKVTFPLGTLYHGSKFAVEGLSEALSFEMEAIGVKVKIVEPGLVDTDFSGRSLDTSLDASMPEYQPVIAAVVNGVGGEGAERSQAGDVAEVIYGAVTDGTDQLRYVVGADAEEITANRKVLDDAAFLGAVKARFGLTPA